MFELEDEEGDEVRPENLFFVFCTVLFVINFDSVFFTTIYISAGFAMATYDPAEEEPAVIGENFDLKEYRKDWVTEFPFTAELMDYESLYELLETGVETVSQFSPFFPAQIYRECSKKVSLASSSSHKRDRLQFIFRSNSYMVKGKIPFDPNLFQYTAKSTSRFEHEDLVLVDKLAHHQLTDADEITKAYNLAMDVYDYMDFATMANHYFFQTHLLNGIFSATEIDMMVDYNLNEYYFRKYKLMQIQKLNKKKYA